MHGNLGPINALPAFKAGHDVPHIRVRVPLTNPDARSEPRLEFVGVTKGLGLVPLASIGANLRFEFSGPFTLRVEARERNNVFDVVMAIFHTFKRVLPSPNHPPHIGPRDWFGVHPGTLQHMPGKRPCGQVFF
jgi:hypothetical protein